MNFAQRHLPEILEDSFRGLTVVRSNFVLGNDSDHEFQFLNFLGELDLVSVTDSALAHDHLESDRGVHSDGVGNRREILNMVMMRTQFVEYPDAESASCRICKSHQ